MDYTKQIASDCAQESLGTAESEYSRELSRKEVAGLNRQSVLVDVGCGNGIDLQGYAQMGFSSLLGIEPSADFRRMAEAQLKDKATILDGRFEVIPLPTASADALLSRHVLHYCADIPQAITETARVLKCGGLFAFIVNSPDYDVKHADQKTGTVSYTLFNGKVSITFPLHKMDDYTGPTFQNYFSLSKMIPLEDEAIDGCPPGECPALFIVGRRNETVV